MNDLKIPAEFPPNVPLNCLIVIHMHRFIVQYNDVSKLSAQINLLAGTQLLISISLKSCPTFLLCLKASLLE
jgi:hypothetical protein